MNSLYLKYDQYQTLNETQLNQLIQLGQDIDEDVLGQLLKIHQDTALVIIDEMRKFCVDKNHAELKKIAHKFKSSCGNLGLMKLHKLCHDLETLMSKSFAENETFVVKDFLDCIEYEFKNSETKLFIYKKAA